MESLKDRSRVVMQEVLTLAAGGDEMLRAAKIRLATLDELAAEIGAQLSPLRALAQTLPKPAKGRNEPTEFEARMLQRYTMQSEREMHVQSRDLPASGASDRGLPAGAAAAAAITTADAPAGDSDLGDNIELF